MEMTEVLGTRFCFYLFRWFSPIARGALSEVQLIKEGDGNDEESPRNKLPRRTNEGSACQSAKKILFFISKRGVKKIVIDI